MVYVPLLETFCDGYIDDLIAMGLNSDDNIQRSQHALPLAVHTIFRPLHHEETHQRKDPLSLRKLSGEGRPEEHKTILGWRVCTRTFRISLPKEKSTSWIHDINQILTPNQKVKAKTLESTIGRLSSHTPVTSSAELDSSSNDARNMAHKLSQCPSVTT